MPKTKSCGKEVELPFGFLCENQASYSIVRPSIEETVHIVSPHRGHKFVGEFLFDEFWKTSHLHKRGLKQPHFLPYSLAYLVIPSR